MNKIAEYLNEHILGEVSSLKAIRRRFSQDGSLLTVTPEIVMFPKVTNDIRKAARFAWQLAEKGHVMGITLRGFGTDQTGAAIGKGIVINTSAHLNEIIHVGLKERIVHVQPGANVRTVNEVLEWQGLKLVNYPTDANSSTIGGAIANDASGEKGTIGEAVEKLEVILANGDVIETSRLSKREVSKKQGLQTLEGEIYRKLDGVLEDNEETIRELARDETRDHAGYKSITKVKQKDGSFDLTPLIIGSQGTLGIISEAVLKTDFFSKDQSIIIGMVTTKEVARDVVDAIKSLEPAILETIDGELFADAIAKGKKYVAFENTTDAIDNGAVIYVSFNDFSDRAQAHKLKKVTKLFAKSNISSVSSEAVALDDLVTLRNVASVVSLSVSDSESVPPTIDGAFVPADRHEDFVSALQELATKMHISLPIKTNILTGSIYVYPTLHLGEVSDKQKVFRLMNEYSALVDRCGGNFVGEDGEGRLKANAAWSLLEDSVVSLYEQIRLVFDPFGTLNPGVKQKNDVKHLVEALRPSYDNADLIDRGTSR